MPISHAFLIHWGPAFTILIGTLYPTVALATDRGPKNSLNVASVTASSTQASSTIPENLLNGNGLEPLGDQWGHTNDAYRDRGYEVGTMWASGDVEGKFDEKPSLLFDFKKPTQVGSLHVWNYNQPGWNGCGVKDVEIYSSIDGQEFKLVAKTTLPHASALPDDPGSRISFKHPQTVQYLKVVCINNWQGYGRFGLSEVRFFSAGSSATDGIDIETRYSLKSPKKPNIPNPPKPATPGAENIVFPPSAGVIDVTAAPYNAKGDGVADDTFAIQSALNDYPSCGAIIYLPNGTYRISRTLHWPMGLSEGQRQKLTCLQGQSRAGVVIQLTDGCVGFTDSSHPKEMINTGGFPAQRFFNSIRNCTVDTGLNNPGAIGVRFNSSNCGSMREVTIRCRDGKGLIGLDQSYADDYGPTFVKGLEVFGFDKAIAVAHGVNGIVYENIKVRKFGSIAIENRGMPITFRSLSIECESPKTAIRNLEWYGFITLVDSYIYCNGQNEADSSRRTSVTSAAIVNDDGGLYVHNVKFSGFQSAIRSTKKGELTEELAVPASQVISHWSSAGLLKGSSGVGMELDVEETPDVPWDTPNNWAVLTDFGGKTDDDQDDTAALQQAMDSGKPTVCLPRGRIFLSKPITIPGHVRRVIGSEAELILPTPFPPGSSIFTVADGPEPVLVVERIISMFFSNNSDANWIDNPTSRTLVLRDIGDIENCRQYEKGNVITGTGKLFLEDVVGRFHFRPGQKVWARWLNPETNFEQRQKTQESQWHLINEGADVWILGIKTEGPGPVMITRSGGRSEVIGGLMYSSGGAKEQSQPAFVFDGGYGNLSITEANFLNTAYQDLVQIRDGSKTTTLLRRGDTPGSPGGSMIPFWSTGKSK